MKHIVILSLIIGLSISSLVTVIIKNVQNEELIFILNSSLKLVSISIIMLLVYAKYRIWKSKYVSTYGYLFNKNGFLQIINIIFIALGIFQFKNNASFFDFHFMPTLFPIAILCLSIFYLNLAHNHLQFNKRIALFK